MANPPEWSENITLHDGTAILLRVVLPEDKELLLDGLAALSPQSRYRRFMSPLKALSESQLKYFTEIDYHDHMALGAIALSGDRARGLGIARYVRLADEPTVAEAAIVVVDSHQRLGLGTILLKALAKWATRNGIERFIGYVLKDNKPMLNLLKELGAGFEPADHQTVRVVFRVPEEVSTLDKSAMGRTFKAVAKSHLPPLAGKYLHGAPLKKIVRLFARHHEHEAIAPYGTRLPEEES